MRAQLIDIAFSDKRTIRVKQVDQPHLDNPLHFHDHCELVWIQQSTGKRIIGDHVDQFSAGDLLLMGPGLPHVWHNDTPEDGSARSRAIVVYFHPEFLLSLSDEPTYKQSVGSLLEHASRGLQIHGQTRKAVTLLLEKITATEGLAKILCLLQIIELLTSADDYRLLASFGYKSNYDQKDNARIQQVYAYLINHFNTDISLETIAGVANLSPNAFCRYFKSKTQKSFVQLLHEIRIGHACKLLQNEQYSIAEICYQCGYNNLTNFNKFFKQLKNCTPTEFRRQLQ
ncbi:AraC family transcriptional regulator [Deminuibacter soli]|uniref:AraC family transcriptional regulator n=1 Tax=Deminuibacter soli TaxID=2291815 RepID=A0A3E1NGD7_9BACT|nr:AraC family transcriptional regulator [Deminuibacter soli]RFM26884.1 AraC family transcriptional regulator [Deminuibacter soli]